MCKAPSYRYLNPVREKQPGGMSGCGVLCCAFIAIKSMHFVDVEGLLITNPSDPFRPQTFPLNGPAQALFR